MGRSILWGCMALTAIAAMEACAPTLGGDPNSQACGAQNANPYYDVPAFRQSGSNWYSQTTLPKSEFSRAFPEFGDISEYQLNEGRSWYHSLQVTGTHKVGNDLTFHGTWTYSKTMDSGGYTYMKLKTDQGEIWSAVNQA